MTTIRSIIFNESHIPVHSSTLKIMFSYLVTHVAALIVVGLFFVLGLFDGGIFSAGSIVMQLLNR